jgi:hypothetical protein
MHRYLGKTWSPDDIERVRALIVASKTARRAELARRVCEAFDWRGNDGELRLMGCRLAMLRMHRDGLIELPPPRCVSRPPRRDFASEKSDPEPGVVVEVRALPDLKVEPVTRGSPLDLWNEYVSRYHYLGYTRIAGAQMRYLITGGEKTLGAMGFGAAAWKVAPRDTFIGWSAETREKRLHLVVNQTRFLILPWVRCQNLATKALAIAARRLPSDWQERYGYRPVLLETFVEKERFRGTCYKAANWQMVGETQGRSRYDRFHAKDKPKKTIWVMPLVRDFRQVLLAPSTAE